jgi:hypothetical protein
MQMKSNTVEKRLEKKYFHVNIGLAWAHTQISLSKPYPLSLGPAYTAYYCCTLAKNFFFMVLQKQLCITKFSIRRVLMNRPAYFSYKNITILYDFEWK